MAIDEKSHVLDNAEALRTYFGEPSESVRRKQLLRLDRHAKAFIALSPFVVIASADASGRADATPRGDAPGFVAVLDDQTLLMPDRPGNRRVDTFLNIVSNPHVGLLFFVPGFIETLRVNGGAAITTDPAPLAPLAIDGKAPQAGLVVRIEEVFFQCGKALIRSDLWNPARQIDRKRFPSLGRVIADEIPGLSAEQTEKAIQESYRIKLY